MSMIRTAAGRFWQAAFGVVAGVGGVVLGVTRGEVRWETKDNEIALERLESFHWTRAGYCLVSLD